ncbi:lipase 3-like [Lutzomyia longipalpis]|uniref:lipase 3-like n=1 Tax=Lutzomyia longipalpis TaxID=7200 RepID=UPI002483325A|nr:lipase 3-like [Lutzomyia longipalpis]
MINFVIFCTIVGISLASPLQDELDFNLYAEDDMNLQDLEGNASVKFPSIPTLIKSYGYPVESHEVETSDGYLLTMHRIPHGRNPEDESSSKKPVVFLQHGLLASSAEWVVTGPNNALALLLADEGYDVWMGNARGNTHSRKHITMSPNERAFWKFTWHEIGIIDVPAMIDYILNETDQKQLHYIGHSQGTTALFVMLSLRPEYNEKITMANALAPVAFMSNAKSPFVRAFAPFVFILDRITSLLGMYEFAPSTTMMQIGGYFLCKDTTFFQEICVNTIFLISGYDSEQLNKTVLPLQMAYVPAGASAKQLVHFGQLFNSRHFRQYDYGLIKNLQVYGSIKPPDYPLENIEAPIALHYSDNDWLASVKDVQHLQSRLKNSLIGAFRVPLPKFNHLDFLWAIDVRTVLYDRVISLMNRYNKEINYNSDTE